MIRYVCTALAIIYVIFSLTWTIGIAFMPKHMCENRIVPIDYIVPAKIAGCWLGGKPMHTKEDAE